MVEDYRQAAERAKMLVLMGEIHANGYLIDQFLQSKSNQLKTSTVVAWESSIISSKKLWRLSHPKRPANRVGGCLSNGNL